MPDPSSPVATDTGASGVAVADVEADTRPDIAVANYTDSSVTILLNGTPFPLPPPPPPPPPPPNLDVDGDGVQIPTDCDDGNPAIRPGAADAPGDGIDQDCSGADAPFPLLDRRIEGFLSTFPVGRYTKFTSLAVKPARAGDTLRLTCRGRGCVRRNKTVRGAQGPQAGLAPALHQARALAQRRGRAAARDAARHDRARREVEDPRPEEPDHLAQLPGARREAAVPLPELIRAAPRARPAL